MSHESEHSESEFYYPGKVSHVELLRRHQRIHRGSKARKPKKKAKYDINVFTCLVCSRINCSVVSTSVLFEETKLNANTSSLPYSSSRKYKTRLCLTVQCPLHKQSQQSQQTQALFAGANICVIKIQLPVVPCLRESKRSTNSPTNSLKRRRHFRESSQLFQWSDLLSLAKFVMALTYFWQLYVNFLSAF